MLLVFAFDALKMYYSQPADQTIYCKFDVECNYIVPPTTAPVTPSSAPGSCPSSKWYHYADWCYLFFPDAHMTWEESKYLCETIDESGATPSSIHDYPENWFISKTLADLNQYPPLSTESWIGLYRTDTGKSRLSRAKKCSGPSSCCNYLQT